MQGFVCQVSHFNSYHLGGSDPKAVSWNGQLPPYRDAIRNLHLAPRLRLRVCWNVQHGSGMARFNRGRRRIGRRQVRRADLLAHGLTQKSAWQWRWLGLDELTLKRCILLPWAATPQPLTHDLLHRQGPEHASSVALMQLRFTWLAVVSLREDLHLRACAHAGRK